MKKIISQKTIFYLSHALPISKSWPTTFLIQLSLNIMCFLYVSLHIDRNLPIVLLQGS